jgi:hypothetical protein
MYIYDISSLRVNTSAHCSGRRQVKGSVESRKKSSSAGSEKMERVGEG